MKGITSSAIVRIGVDNSVLCKTNTNSCSRNRVWPYYTNGCAPGAFVLRTRVAQLASPKQRETTEFWV